MTETIRAQGLDHDRVGCGCGQAEARRDTRLVNRQQQIAVVGWNLLQFRTMDATAVEIREVMGMAVPLTMPVAVSVPGAC